MEPEKKEASETVSLRVEDTNIETYAVGFMRGYRVAIADLTTLLIGVACVGLISYACFAREN